MPNWFYYDESGSRNGPIPTEHLKQLADSGVILPDTIIESDNGQKAYAKNTKGLFTVREPATKKMETPLPAPPLPETPVSVSPLPPQWFYYANDGTKHGPFSAKELKFLADTDVIQAGTILESATGEQTMARNVPVLFNTARNVPTPPPPVNPPVPKPPGETETEKQEQWYYLDADGNKIGPVTMFQLELLAENGTITPETIVEAEKGKQTQARNMPELNFKKKVDVTPENSHTGANVNSDIQTIGKHINNEINLLGYLLGNFVVGLVLIGVFFGVWHLNADAIGYKYATGQGRYAKEQLERAKREAEWQREIEEIRRGY